MTSSLMPLRALIAGVALCWVMPAAAQDIRNIPEKIDTRVTGPVQPKQGREVQGPPAPLETQLRDTPPDEPVVRQPAPQPQVPIQPRASSESPVSGRQAEPLPRGIARPAQRTAAPAAAAPDQRQMQPNATAPAVGAMQGASPAPAAGDAPIPVTGLPDAPTAAPAVAVDGAPNIAAEPEAGAANISAKPASDGLVWALGGVVLALLGGVGYALMRRKRTAPAGASDFGGITFGQTPDAKALGPVPSPIARQPAEREAPPPQPRSAAASTPPPPPPPVKPSSDGRIVSRLRAGADEPPPPAPGPRPVSPTPSAPPAPPPVIPASDGRIVSRLKVSDLVEEEAAPPPPPPPPARRRTGPAVRTVSVGYSVKGKDAE